MRVFESLQAVLIPKNPDPGVVSTSDYVTKHVTQFNMCGHALPPDRVSSLASSLPSLLSLKGLNLTDSNIDSEAAVRLAPSIACFNSLESLYLSKNNMGPAGVAAIAPNLKGLTNLIFLELNGNGFGSLGAVHLSGSLQYLINLEMLCLMDNGFGDAGISALAEPLGKLIHLEVHHIQCIGHDHCFCLSGSIVKVTTCLCSQHVVTKCLCSLSKSNTHRIKLL